MNIEEEVVVERERERRRIGGKEQLCQNDRMNYRRNCSIMENDCGFKTIYSTQRVEIGKGAVSSCAMTSCQISFYICERCYSLLEHTKLILRFYCCSSSVGHFKVFYIFAVLILFIYPDAHHAMDEYLNWHDDRKKTQLKSQHAFIFGILSSWWSPRGCLTKISSMEIFSL